MVADRVTVGAQAQLVRQPQRAVPFKAKTGLLAAGAFVSMVVAVSRDAPGLEAFALECDTATAHRLARHQLKLRLARGQASQLIDPLLQLA